MPDPMQELNHPNQDHQERLRRFREAARAIGEEIERQGLTEEELDQIVEAIRQQLYEEKHGHKPMP